MLYIYFTNHIGRHVRNFTIQVDRIGLKEDRSTFTKGALYYNGRGARGTLKHQFSGTSWAFSESAHQKEPENTYGKVEKLQNETVETP